MGLTVFDCYNRLITAVHATYPDVPIETMVVECLDLYMQHLFPLMPLLHEATQRANLSLVPAAYGSPAHDWPTRGWAIDTAAEELRVMRSFALTTAICAEVASVLPASIYPRGPALAGPLLRASRDMLHFYLEKDVESPDSSSLIIRYFHCNCVHTTGKTRVSWYKLGEAIRLAQEMRLHDESSLVGLDPVETQLRRNIFWQLYTGDKSAAILNKRPFTLHDFNLDTPITTSFGAEVGTYGHTSLLDSGLERSTQTFQKHLKAGFDMCQRLWTAASGLLFDLHLISASSTTLVHQSLTPDQNAVLMDAYLSYVGVLDDMFPWTEENEGSEVIPEGARRFQQRSLSAQKANLMVTYHCLNLILLQKFAEAGMSHVVGISSEPLMLALRKTEIAQALLRVLQETPFEALQVNGEPCVC